MNRPRFTLVFLSLLLLCGAPLAAEPAAAAPESAPAKLDPKSPEGRAVARWEAVIAGKYEDAYGYLSPGVQSAKPKAAWVKEISERPVRWTKARFFDKACDSETACLVRLEVHFTAPLQGAPGGMLSSPSFLTEHWIKVKRRWYFVPDDYVAGGLR